MPDLGQLLRHKRFNYLVRVEEGEDGKLILRPAGTADARTTLLRTWTLSPDNAAAWAEFEEVPGDD